MIMMFQLFGAFLAWETRNVQIPGARGTPISTLSKTMDKASLESTKKAMKRSAINDARTNVILLDSYY